MDICVAYQETRSFRAFTFWSDKKNDTYHFWDSHLLWLSDLKVEVCLDLLFPLSTCNNKQKFQKK